MKIDTHNLIVNFGRHKGERWTRIPVSYLRWLANEGTDENLKIAKSELKRRCVTVPTELQLSNHAINRASQITTEWKRQGVYTWLYNNAEKALKQAKGEEEYEFRNYKFVFTYGNYYPILKTIFKK